MAIGVFDSGIGGLTVFRTIAKEFPKLDIYYFGDTARVPYGIRSKDTIIKYTSECIDYLVKHYNLEAIVIACNSASSYAIDSLKSKFNLPVLGVIDPGVRAALSATKTNNLLVIGTKATVNSNAYPNKIKQISPSTKVYQQACPLFVPIVEEGLFKHKVAEIMVKEYLSPYIDKVDTVILGCTHYPLLKDTILKLYPNLNLVDSSIAILDDLRNLQITFNESGKRLIHITDKTQSFETLKNILAGNTPYKIINL